MKSLHNKWMLLPLSLCLLLVFSFCSKNDALASNEDNSDNGNNGNISGKVLVAYFSRANYVPDGTDGVTGATNKAGNTKTVAQYIQEKTGGTLFEIVPERNYPISHTECSAIAQQEAENNERPSLKSHVENMEDYDIVFVGFPIWVYREPMAVLTFLEEYDFKDKTVIPFCTSMAVGISASEDDFKKTLSDADIKSGLRINYTLSGNWQGEVDHWIDRLGLNPSTSVANTTVSSAISINKEGNKIVVLGKGHLTATAYNVHGVLVSKAAGKEHLEMDCQNQSRIAVVRVTDGSGKVATQKINR